MAEINAQDISVYKNGVWRSLKTAKIYKNGAWHDFQGVAKNGNWYKVQQGLQFITVNYYIPETRYLFITPRPITPTMSDLSWVPGYGDEIVINFGETLSDRTVLVNGQEIYLWIFEEPNFILKDHGTVSPGQKFYIS